MKPKRGRPRKSENQKRITPTLNLHKETKQSLAIVVCVAAAILSLLALVNISGSLGELAVAILRLVFGWGAFLLPLFFLLTALSLYQDLQEKENKEETSSRHTYLGIFFLTLVVISFMQLVASREILEQFNLANEGRGGGYIGAGISYLILKTIGPWAGFILLLAGSIASILVAFNIPLTELLPIGKTKDEEVAAEKQKVADNGVRINDPGRNGFKVEQVGNANPVAASLSKLAPKKVPKFVDKNSETKPAEPAKPKVQQNWKFPPLDLFEESNASVDSGNIEANVAIIQKTLADFDISVEMGEVNVGPTVTQYTLRPAEGIRLSAIVALQNDLKLALAASSIRIEAPIPGKSLVGIEVPNKTTAVVRLRELYGQEDFQSHRSPLAFVLGRDVAGKGAITDLAGMPHLLIAGSTGSGKSVAINVVLTSFLMRNTPQDVKFIIIDPKRVEMSLYNDIPHLVTPIIVDHQKAVNALKWTVAEMDRRYQTLQDARKRNISEYNNDTSNPMHYLVVIVDELADLMAVARNDVEAAIVRLAQMARAVGIHLILATQRPSVDIITGLIKANVTSRVAFAVASQVDSRTILDQSGAEKLLGKGDLLYVTAEMAQPRRLQGAFISEKEVKKVTDFLKNEGQPEYNESVTEKIKISSMDHNSGGDGLGADEPLLEEAKNLVIETGKASASYLQRRMRIGYARAARILDLLEEQGIVGPAEGAKPREVYSYAENSDGQNSGEEFNQNDEQNTSFL